MGIKLVINGEKTKAMSISQATELYKLAKANGKEVDYKYVRNRIVKKPMLVASSNHLKTN
jgi:hypothetical protein